MARCVVLFFGVCSLVGCGAGWHKLAHPAPRAFSPRQQVQIWRHGAVDRWHAVAFTQDSVAGIPYLLPTDCTGCRIVYPWAEVDSMRAGDPVAGFWKTVVLVVAAPFLLVELACAGSGHFPNCWPTRD